VGASETAWQTGTGTTTDALLDAEGSRLAITTGGTVKWLVFDLHGSVVALVNAGASSLSDAYRFDGWGEQIASAGTAVNPWRYRGLLNVGADAESGALLDMAARHYSPGLGVFTQEDSVQGTAANPLTMNRYQYALASPSTLIDPDGHCPWCVAIPIIEALAPVGEALIWGGLSGIAGLVGWNVIGPAINQNPTTTPLGPVPQPLQAPVPLDPVRPLDPPAVVVNPAPLPMPQPGPAIPPSEPLTMGWQPKYGDQPRSFAEDPYILGIHSEWNRHVNPGDGDDPGWSCLGLPRWVCVGGSIGVVVTLLAGASCGRDQDAPTCPNGTYQPPKDPPSTPKPSRTPTFEGPRRPIAPRAAAPRPTSNVARPVSYPRATSPLAPVRVTIPLWKQRLFLL
jgi:RHS repeat-associated protein